MGIMGSIYAKEDSVDELSTLLIGARNAANIGLTEKATRRYEAYLEEKPEDNIVKLEFAELLHNRGLYARADEHYDYLVKNIENIPGEDDEFKKRLLVAAARNALQNKREERAVDLYDHAFQYGEVEAKVKLEFAELLNNRGLYARADEHYDYLVKNIENIPGEDDEFKKRLLVAAARNALQNKREERAVDLYDHAFQYGEVEAKVKLEFAELLHNRGLHARADEHYDYLVKNIENIPGEDDEFKKRLLVAAARNALQNKREERAVDLYDHAFQYGEVEAKVKLEFAELLNNRGLHARADEHYDYLVKNIENIPGEDDEFKKILLVAAARNALQNKREERAVDLYDHAFQYGEVEAKVKLEFAELLNNRGLHARADEHYDYLVKNIENIPGEDDEFKKILLVAAARHALQNKREERAVDLYDHAFQYGEVEAKVKLEFAELLHNRGLYARADEHYDYLVKNIENIPGEDDEFKKILLVAAARNALQNKREERAVDLYDHAFQYGEVEAKVKLEFAELLSITEAFMLEQMSTMTI